MALAWCFPDERAAHPAAVLDSLAARRAVVPGLWSYEIASALLAGERRHRATADNTATWLRFLSQLPIAVDDEPVHRTWENSMAMARKYRLSAYDAAYIELALRLSLPLATLDQPLQKAAKAADVGLYSV